MAYKAYTQLQKKYTQMYRELELQYETCKCFNCKLKVITFGLELLALNSFLSGLETQITPDIKSILENLQIGFVISESGQTELIN